jgi:hypothetical protein
MARSAQSTVSPQLFLVQSLRFQLASEFMGTDETSEMYLRQAAELEEGGRFKEAEELYVAVGQPNRAIAM